MINDYEVFKCDKSSYGPELFEDDKVVLQAYEYAFSRRSEQLIQEYLEMEKSVKKVSVLDSIFRKKEVSELKKKFAKLQVEYLKIKSLRDNSALLKFVAEHKATPTVPSGGNVPPQPGEF